LGRPGLVARKKIANFQSKHVLTIENATRTRRESPRKTEAVEAAAQTLSLPPSDALSLDQEIDVLRKQLVIRLHLQNAQAKNMLKRFESQRALERRTGWCRDITHDGLVGLGALQWTGVKKRSLLKTRELAEKTATAANLPGSTRPLL
jgi:hypothetical protein